MEKIPLNGGMSNDAVSDAQVKLTRDLAAHDREIARRLTQLRQRDVEIGAAAQAAVNVVIAQAHLSGSRLAALKRAAEVITDYEKNGAALIVQQRERRQAQHAADQLAAVEAAKQRAQADARAHPMTGREIIAAVTKANFKLRLRGNHIEISPSHGLPPELEAQIVERASMVTDGLREDWRRVARVPSPAEET